MQYGGGGGGGGGQAGKTLVFGGRQTQPLLLHEISEALDLHAKWGSVTAPPSQDPRGFTKDNAYWSAWCPAHSRRLIDVCYCWY